MLSKLHRLTKEKDFDMVFKKGNSLKNGFLLLKVVANHLPESRFGFVVSKKVSNKAVVRNKTKRRMRSVVVTLGPLKKPYDVIMIALPGIQKQEFLEIKEAICGAFKKLKLI